MKMKSKALLLTLCAVLLVAASVLGTMAYLSSADEVKNTFTVGQVKITLDEAKVDETGKAISSAARVSENSYKLMPGHAYDKDPTVTLHSGSEECYVRMLVTVSNAKELDAIFAAHPTLSLTEVMTGYNAAEWLYQGTTKDTEQNTRTYEFWYKTTVSAPNADLALTPLFTGIQVPGELTNEEMLTVNNLTILVNAHAIQKDGFETPEQAWAAFG